MKMNSLLNEIHQSPPAKNKFLEELEKAMGTKYNFRKRGIDKKTGRSKWVYTYTKPKTSSSITKQADQAVKGSAFVFHHNGQRGHFHVEAEDPQTGKLTITHDETGHSVEVSKGELKAILMFEHKEALEAHAKAKTEQAKKRGAKTKSGKHKGAENVAERARRSAQEAQSLTAQASKFVGKKKTPTRTKLQEAIEEKKPSKDNFETMPESKEEPAKENIFEKKSPFFQAELTPQVFENLSRGDRKFLIINGKEKEYEVGRKIVQRKEQVKKIKMFEVKKNGGADKTKFIRLQHHHLEKQVKAELTPQVFENLSRGDRKFLIINGKEKEYEVGRKIVQRKEQVKKIKMFEVKKNGGADKTKFIRLQHHHLEKQVKAYDEQGKLVDVQGVDNKKTRLSKFVINRGEAFEINAKLNGKTYTLQDGTKAEVQFSSSNNVFIILDRQGPLTVKYLEEYGKLKTSGLYNGNLKGYVFQKLYNGMNHTNLSLVLKELGAVENKPSKDNFETMPESKEETGKYSARSKLEQETQSVKEEINPSLQELSDPELKSERKRKDAELVDQGTLIDEAKKKKQPIKELRRQEKKLEIQKNALDNEVKSRQKAQGVPAEAEVLSLVEKLKQLVKENPSLAKTPEIMAMLGSGNVKKENYSENLNTDLVVTVDGKTKNVPVKYKVIEAGDAIPSHDATGFFKRKDYPKNIQEREYHSRKGPEQNKVINQAKNLNAQLLINTNPDATNGPPILTPDGIALGGNSRVMSVQRAYLAHPEKAQEYKDFLKKKAETFGINPADLDQFSAPLLVREYAVEDQSKANLSKLVRAMNENLTQAFDPLAEGKATATKLLGENRTLGALAVALRESPEGTTLNTLLKTSGTRLEGLKNALFADGILSSRNSNAYIDQKSGQFNDRGVAFIKKMILGYVIRDDTVLRSLTPSVEDHLEQALVKLSAIGLKEKDSEKLENSIRIFNHLMNRDTKYGGIRARMDPVDRYNRMTELMENEQELSFTSDADPEELNFDKYKGLVKKDPLSNAFLKILTLANTPRKLNSAMDSFIKLVSVDSMDMFSPEPLDFTRASKQIADKLSDEYGVKSGLFKSIQTKSRSALYKALYKI